MTPTTPAALPELPEPCWIAIDTPGADFDVTFVRTQAEVRELEDGENYETINLFSETQLVAYGQACADTRPLAPTGVAVAWRGLNILGEVVTDWQDGSGPGDLVDLCGIPASYASIEYAYTTPPPNPEVRALVKAVRDELESGFNVAPTPTRAALRQALTDLERGK